MCKHGHSTCSAIREFRNSKKWYKVGGVAAFLVNLYYKKGSSAKHNGRKQVLLGKERDGQYAGQYSLCAGGVDAGDGECYLYALAREMYEEFCINLFADKARTQINWPLFDKMFKSGSMRYVMHHGTPIFVGDVSGLSRDPINKELAKRRSRNTPHSMCEMECVEWIDIGSLFYGTPEKLDGSSANVSDFARGAARTVSAFI